MLREVDGTRGAGSHRDGRHDRAAQPDPQRLVEGEAPRPAVRERGQHGEDHGRVLDPAVRDPEPVLTMDVPDRVRHHAAEHAHCRRREEAECEERAAAGFGRTGDQRVLSSRAQADLVEHLSGPFGAAAAEPAGELLHPVAEEVAAEGCA